MPDDSDNARLRELEARRARREAKLADEAEAPIEQRTHQRRADKAEYLREKLEDQAAWSDE
jgi:uncharacterized coiled-coil protein SlyX